MEAERPLQPFKVLMELTVVIVVHIYGRTVMLACSNAASMFLVLAFLAAGAVLRQGHGLWVQPVRGGAEWGRRCAGGPASDLSGPSGSAGLRGLPSAV